MTLLEFKAWLEGYIEGGGTDLERVRLKLQLTGQDFPTGWPVGLPQPVPYQPGDTWITCQS